MKWLNVFLLISVSLLASADYASSLKESAKVATPTEGTGISAEPIKPHLRAYDIGDEERNALIGGGFFAFIRRILDFITRKMKKLEELRRRSDSVDDVFKKWVAYKYPVIKDDRIDVESVRRLFRSAGMRYLADFFEHNADELIKMFVNYYGPVRTTNVVSALVVPGRPWSKKATAWIELLNKHWRNNPNDLAAVQKARDKGLTKEASSVLASFEKSQENAAKIR